MPKGKEIKSIPKGVLAKAKVPAGLTELENHFIEVYLRTGNATEAARACGRKSPSDGHRLVNAPRIAAEIEKRRLRQLDKIGVTADMVVEELAHIAFSQLPDIIKINGFGEPYFDLDNLSPTMKRSIKSITLDTVMVSNGKGKMPTEVRKTRVDLYDKLGALTTLARHFGLLKDKVEHTGPGGGPIQVAQQKTREVLEALSPEALEELDIAIQHAVAKQDAEDV